MVLFFRVQSPVFHYINNLEISQSYKLGEGFYCKAKYDNVNAKRSKTFYCTTNKFHFKINFFVGFTEAIPPGGG